MEIRIANSISPAFEKIAKEMPQVMSRAINRVAASARTEASKRIREVYTIKKRDLDPAIDVQKSTRARLVAVVTAGSTRFGAGEFSPRRTKRPPGVTVEIKRGGRRPVAGAFLVKTRGKRQIVYKRVGKGRRELKEVKTLSVGEMFGSRGVMTYIDRRIDERMPVEVEHQLDVELRKLVPADAGRGYERGGYIGGPSYHERKMSGRFAPSDIKRRP